MLTGFALSSPILDGVEEMAAPIPRRTGSALRRELSARNLQRASAFEHETTWGEVPSVVYAEAEDGSHGNFFPASYRRILAHPEWCLRLEKAYSASRRIAYADRRQRRELDCAASSDALLMNVFCHPTVLRSTRLQALLGVDCVTKPEFGVRARIPLLGGYEDRTELDMVLSCADCDLLVEAKLSETDFQAARPDLLARYQGFAETFDVDLLSRRRGLFLSYQLLRSVLVAAHRAARFAVVLDSRRTDLIEDVFLVYRAVLSSELRSRLHVITWQEIAACVPRTLQRFLADKYGIEAAS